MKGRKHRASGGVNEAAEDLKHKNQKYTYESHVNSEAEERKHGGRTAHRKPRKTGGKAMHDMQVHGEHAKHHAGRKPRKSGGRLAGSDWAMAQKSMPAKGRNVSGSIEE
jgi:hypothetical protein